MTNCCLSDLHLTRDLNSLTLHNLCSEVELVNFVMHYNTFDIFETLVSLSSHLNSL